MSGLNGCRRNQVPETCLPFHGASNHSGRSVIHESKRGAIVCELTIGKKAVNCSKRRR